MYRILFTAALLAIAPACVHAQAAPAKPASDVAAQAPRRSHNPFGAAIIELTRAAREQAAATSASPKTAVPAARDATSPKSPNASPAAATAPTLADANRS
jgi:hypothetical protein